MSGTFWQTVGAQSEARWWFGAPALLLGLAALLLVLPALARLSSKRTSTAIITALGLSTAVALLLPGLLLTLWPQAALGLPEGDLSGLPSATFPAAVQLLDRTVQMGYLGSAALLVGALGMTGLLGGPRGTPCPDCQRPLHPSWAGVCPECRLMDAGAGGALAAPDRADLDGSPTVFGAPERTALLDGGDSDAWVEVLQGASGVGERFAVGARLTIGRDPHQCVVVLDDDTVSACHAAIEREGSGFVLHDRGSRNGCFVNDERVASRTLVAGDRLRVGRTELCFALAAPGDNAPTVLMETPRAARLVLLDGPQAGRQIPLERLDTRIGRGRQNDLVIDSPAVSRHHASVQFDGAAFLLVDTGSPNGTWLDQTRVRGSAPLRHGQVLRLGDQRLRFEEQEAADAA
ncbi:MAG TPA: FHA domain-containing protein [Roseiflexaceae bacterium]|nr:FHA domain-containing protein [Roseiflexaceae bacterium]